MTQREIFVVGAGRMGRGIAQSYAVAGVPACLVDLKDRSEDDQKKLRRAVKEEIGKDLAFASDVGLLHTDRIEKTLNNIRITRATEKSCNLSDANFIFEAVPEIIDVKKAAFEWISQHASADAVVASTTSTLNVDELAKFVADPSRFLNAHWLNPAHLMPLVELGVGTLTSEETFDRMKASLVALGKVPVRCAASPGLIVGRIQALAMNEAARLVEEGVANAEDVDTAVRVGFGLRFAVLGLLEFIDWGGNDILYYGSQHLSRTVDSERYKLPDIVESNMKAGRNGLREGVGFYDYGDMNVDGYCRERLTSFVNLIEHLGLLPAGLRRAKEDEKTSG